MQIMPYEDAKTYHINPFDLTKVWPHEDYPLTDVAGSRLTGTQRISIPRSNSLRLNRTILYPAPACRLTRCCSVVRLLMRMPTVRALV